MPMLFGTSRKNFYMIGNFSFAFTVGSFFIFGVGTGARRNRLGRSCIHHPASVAVASQQPSCPIFQETYYERRHSKLGR
jgi:hypothetical protein